MRLLQMPGSRAAALVLLYAAHGLALRRKLVATSFKRAKASIRTPYCFNGAAALKLLA
jgi:hypothetical protein